jgi:hypothetical protein
MSASPTIETRSNNHLRIITFPFRSHASRAHRACR